MTATPKHRAEARTHRRWRWMVPVTAVAVLALSTVATAENLLDWKGGPPPSGGGGNSVTDGTNPNANSLSLGARWWPYAPAPGVLASTPLAYAWDHVVDGRTTKKTLVEIESNQDSSTAVLNNTILSAEDNAKIFVPDEGPGKDFSYGAMGRLRDGTLLASMFRPTGVNGQVAVLMARSTDLGKTWTRWSAPITENKWKMNWYRFNGREIVELDDGTLIMGAYGTHAADSPTANQFAIVLQSTDGGKTWSQRSELDTDGDSNEFAMSRATDGRLIAVSRSAELANTPSKPMKQTYSDDDGLTWSPQTTYAPPKGLPSEGIQPDLVLQSNGALVLSYGRPDNYVAVSWDGTGRHWDTGKLVYSNYIRKGFLGRWMGTSGNGSITPAESNYSVAFGDTCVVVWSCQEYGQQDNDYAQRVDAVTPGKGKIDLATGVHDGTVKLTGDVVPTDARFAEQRLAGAVDGSSAYLAAARFPDQTAAAKGVTFDLGKTYSLNRIGLMLDRGKANSAVVETSTDGSTWGSPVVQQLDSTDYAVRYHDLAKPVTARYVRVRGAGGDVLTAVNEIELYASDMWTFENDAINVTPRGVEDTLHTFTADTIMPGQDSERRMILVDTDPNSEATATLPIKNYAGLQMSFGYAGEGYGTGANWEFRGPNASGKETTAWRFHFRPSTGNTGFTLTQWDGKEWKTVGTFPTFTPNYQWIPVQATVTGNQVSFTVHGATVTATDPLHRVTSFNAFRPSTGLAVADTNMEHSYDNIQIDPA